MSNGPTDQDTTGTSSSSPDETQETLVNLTEPMAPEDVFVEEYIDGFVDIDAIRRDEVPADPQGPESTQTVARATDEASETGTTLDEPVPPLPIVDVHCHIHGVSLSKGEQALRDFEQHGIFNGNDLTTEKKRKAYQKAVTSYYQTDEEMKTTSGALSDTRRFGHWNFRDDPWVAKKIIFSTQRFQDSLDEFDVGHPIVITPMLLDFGYTPLGTSAASKGAKFKGSGSSMKESEAREEEDADTGIFYFSKNATSEKSHRFFPRDKATFEYQIKVLHLMGKLWPGQIMPFCPYDPRRPDCLDHVRRAMDSQCYVGVKLYARCGWMPYNNGALHGDEVGAILDGRLDELYAYVTENDIPILNHTSPTGHPPDGALVYPWRLTKEASATDRTEAEAHAPVPFPPTTWTKPDTYTRGRTKAERSLEKMQYELTSYGYYCLYDQLTTSPYSWEPVLQNHPTLRLCFAHFGSKLGVYAHPRYNVNSHAAQEDCEELLIKNPIVAGATGHRTFKDYFKKGALYYRNDGKWIKDDHAEDSVETLFADGADWANWVDAWQTAYPKDWTSKITELVTDYENVYTDISFITGNGDSIPDIIGPLFDDAAFQRQDGKRLFDKCMIGTDWYMTELADLSPSDFWRLVQRSCKMDPEAFENVPEEDQPKRKKTWDYWASKNAFRYLNIKPRLNNTGMDKLVTAYGCEKNKLPIWWDALEQFYDDPEDVEPPG